MDGSVWNALTVLKKNKQIDSNEEKTKLSQNDSLFEKTVKKNECMLEWKKENWVSLWLSDWVFQQKRGLVSKWVT